MPWWCPHILLVDDDPGALAVLKALLDFEGYSIGEAVDGVDAVRKLKTERYDAVVTDYHMPRMDGLHLLQEVRRHWPTIPVIMLSSEEVGEFAIRNGAYAWMPKPYAVSEFIQTVRRAVMGTYPTRVVEPESMS